ncbi:MAG: hypothetical protein Q9222_000514 [Ikaeria aurantiellina]
MATGASVTSRKSSRPTYSCIRCADRKVKCDRQRPCGACVRHHVDCVFTSSQPHRRERRRVKDQILSDRLKHYEALLQEQGIDPGKLPLTPESEAPVETSSATGDVPQAFQAHTPSSIDSEPTRSITKTQVVHGQGRSGYVENSLWSRVVEEYQDPEDVLESSENESSGLEASDDNLGYVVGSHSKADISSRHPPPERIRRLWHIYQENVDPMTKVVHVPSLEPAIQKAASNSASLPRTFEALIFAIYAAAVMSLNNDDCRERLGEPRKTLLSRYTAATKVALSRAKFMSSTNLAVLQALVLHIITVRDIYEPRTIWSLTGVAVRIAQGMGIERDGLSMGLPPFETEMRRRLWWLIKTHDFRTAELCGLAKFRDLDMNSDSTKFPANVNDDQLYPGMPSPPTESNNLTDMAFLAMRYQLANFAKDRVAVFKQQGKDPNKWDLHASASDEAAIDEAARSLEEILETKYLRYCDPTQPLHFLTMVLARHSVNIVRFLSHHPRRWASIEQTPLSERQWIWGVSIKIIEQHSMLMSNPTLKPYAWHAPYFMQWHAFIHVLDTLCAQPLAADAEKAWKLVGTTYENNSDLVFDTRKPVHVAVGNLCLKAYGAREAAVEREDRSPLQIPRFISQLRQQREMAKAKRQARDAKRAGSDQYVSNGQGKAHDLHMKSDVGVFNPSNFSQSMQLAPSTTSQTSNLPQTGDPSQGDPFWFMNGFDDSQFGSPSDMMDLDLDLMMGQDFNTDGASGRLPIPWEQWDAWLADSNKMRPLASSWDMEMNLGPGWDLPQQTS